MMKCTKIKKILPLYMEGELKPNENQAVTEHLNACLGCRQEKEALAKAWNLLSTWEDVQPSSNYVSRFWTEVSLRQPWQEKFLDQLTRFLPNPRWTPAFAAVCLVVIAGLFSFYNYRQVQKSNTIPVTIPVNLVEVDLEMIENMELAENYEMIVEDIDFLEDLNVIENLDTLDNSETQGTLES